MSVVLGKDIETGTVVKIGDTERFSGLYILGKSGTGKSTLLVSLALQDIEQGNGLLFIDPHSDAINAILERMPKGRAKDVVLLDPTDKNYAFGINPLYCVNPHDPQERELAFGQARDLFAKVFESDEKLKILLSKYLRNILYPLIENPGSTLYDIELMLTHPPFRDYLLKNVKYNPKIVQFWHTQFDTLSRHDQYEELKSTLNRISLFERPYIRDIIIQPKPTIDFAEIMQSRKIVLLSIPIWLDEETRSFIGTLVISQLLKIIFLRANTIEQLRVPFALYCDEFHNFATPDFARLFAQTRKFKIMPVVAHQHRTQFKPDDPNKGATLAAPNKVHFNLNKEDADEFAIEVAKKPPTQIKQERELVISQSPVEDLLQGHVNPEIRRFVNRYLRPMQERTEDIKDEMEVGKLIKMELQDEAAFSRLEAQIEGLDRFERDYSAMEKSLTRARESIARSFYETDRLMGLHYRSSALKQTRRSFNYFLTATMEGQIAPGQEQFSNFLIEQAQNFSGISEKHKQILSLYIQLQYGDAMAHRVIPFAFAQACGLFHQTVSGIQQDIEKKREWKKREYLKYDLNRSLFPYGSDRAPDVKKLLANWRVRSERAFYIQDYCVNYMFLHRNPELQTLLKPYFTSRFAPSWKAVIPDIQNLDKLIENTCEEISKLSDASENLFRQCCSFCPDGDVYVKESLIADLKEFLRRFREGAFVVFSLLWVARNPTMFGRDSFGYYYDKYPGSLNMLWFPAIVGKEPLEILLLVKKMGDIISARKYLFSWDEVPGNDSERLKEALKQVFCTSWIETAKIEKTNYHAGKYISVKSTEKSTEGKLLWLELNDEKTEVKITQGDRHSKFFTITENGKLYIYTRNNIADFLPYFTFSATSISKFCYYGDSDPGCFDRALESRHFYIYTYDLTNDLEKIERRADMQMLTYEMQRRLGWPNRLVTSSPILTADYYNWEKRAVLGFNLLGSSLLDLWNMLSELERLYLRARACDIAHFGTSVADQTWPQPTITGVAVVRVSDLVSLLVDLETDVVKEIGEKGIELNEDEKRDSNLIPMPDNLAPRALNENEREAVKKACLGELLQNGEGKLNALGMLAAINEITDFCNLLSKPENHIKKPSGQYVEKEVPLRTEADMVGEMRRELTDLPNFTAYAKIMQVENGNQATAKHKINTPIWYELPGKWPGDIAAKIKQEILEQTHQDYCQNREIIEREISQKQAAWQKDSSEKPPSSGRH